MSSEKRQSAAWFTVLTWLPISVVLVVGAFLRLHNLATVPQGLLFDEAYNGIDVIKILGGERPVFLADNYGREALFIYLQALSVAAFGRSDFALRIVSAAIGILTIAIAYSLLRKLFDRSIALLACGWLAFSLWHVIFSRIGLRSVSLPLFEAIAFYWFWRAWSEEKGRARNRRLYYAIAGLALGLTLYTYSAGRFAPFVLLVFAVYVALWHRARIRSTFRGIILVGLISGLVFLPEAWYFVNHPETFTSRAEVVSVLNPEVNRGDVVAATIESARLTLGMFSFGGDQAWDRNLPGRPVFDPISSVLAALGLILCLRRWRQPAYAFLIVWLMTMLVPAIIAAKGAPNFLRETGALPGLFALPALGFAWLAQRFGAIWHSRPLRVLPAAIVVAGFVIGSLATYRTYFGPWAHAPVVLAYFGSDRWLALQEARDWRSDDAVYVAAGDIDDELVRYFYGDSVPSAPRLFDPTHSLILPKPGQSATYLLPTSRLPEPAVLNRIFKSPVGSTVSQYGARVYAYQFPADQPAPSPRFQVDLRFGNSLRLLGYDMPSEMHLGEPLKITWYWEVLASDPRELGFFNHLLNLNGQRFGQSDIRVLPRDYWQTKDRGMTFAQVTGSPDTPTGAYWLSFGIYDRATLARLPVFDAQGRAIGDQVRLGPLKVRGQNTPIPTIQHELRNARFLDSVNLLGYDLAWGKSDDRAHAVLTLYWQARGRPSRDYTVFVHLLDGQERLLTQSDGPPVGGGYPTSLWDEGEIIVDRHELALDRASSAEDATFLIGLYDATTGARVPVINASGSNDGDSVRLGR